MWESWEAIDECIASLGVEAQDFWGGGDNKKAGTIVTVSESLRNVPETLYWEGTGLILWVLQHFKDVKIPLDNNQRQ